MSGYDAKGFWRANIRLVLFCLAICFVVGITFALYIGIAI